MDNQIILIVNIFLHSELLTLRRRVFVSNTVASYSRSIMYPKTSTVQITNENQRRKRKMLLSIEIEMVHT